MVHFLIVKKQRLKTMPQFYSTDSTAHPRFFQLWMLFFHHFLLGSIQFKSFDPIHNFNSTHWNLANGEIAIYIYINIHVVRWFFCKNQALGSNKPYRWYHHHLVAPWHQDTMVGWMEKISHSLAINPWDLRRRGWVNFCTVNLGISWYTMIHISTMKDEFQDV